MHEQSNDTPEEWRTIPGYEGFYEASNHGRIRSNERASPHRRERILKPGTHKLRYLQVALCREGRGRSMKVHRLVAMAFLGLPVGERTEVNHRDGNRANNRLENLEWNSRLENQRHAVRTGLKIASMPGSKHPNARLTEDQVNEIRKLADVSSSVIAITYGIHRSHVHRIRKGISWS